MDSPIASGPGWRRCCRRRSRGVGARPRTIGGSSMPSSGSSAPGRPGAISRSGTARGPRCTAASAAGAWPACGTGCLRQSSTRRMRPAKSTGTCTSWMAPWSVRTSMRPVQKRGPCTGSARAQPGRLQHEGPCPSRRWRQADHGTADAWAAARIDGVPATAGARRSATSRPRSPTRATAPRGWRQGLHGPSPPRLLPPPWYSLHDPSPEARAPSGSIRPPALSPSSPGRESDRSFQALPLASHSL